MMMMMMMMMWPILVCAEKLENDFSLPYQTDVNPLKGSGIEWLHFEVFSAIQV